MKCPICNDELTENAESVYPGRPSFTCFNVETEDNLPDNVRPIHYMKYYSMDWSYARYEEYVTLFPFRIINYYRDCPSNSYNGIIQKYQFRDRLGPVFGNNKFYTLLRLANTIRIPSRQHFEDKIKTLLLFS